MEKVYSSLEQERGMGRRIGDFGSCCSASYHHLCLGADADHDLQPRRGSIILWYESSHYSWCEGSLADGDRNDALFPTYRGGRGEGDANTASGATPRSARFGAKPKCKPLPQATSTGLAPWQRCTKAKSTCTRADILRHMLTLRTLATLKLSMDTAILRHSPAHKCAESDAYWRKNCLAITSKMPCLMWLLSPSRKIPHPRGAYPSTGSLY